MIAAQLGEGVGGAQIDGAAQLREARWELARQIIAFQPPAMCRTTASHHGRLRDNSGLSPAQQAEQ